MRRLIRPRSQVTPLRAQREAEYSDPCHIIIAWPGQTCMLCMDPPNRNMHGQRHHRAEFHHADRCDVAEERRPIAAPTAGYVITFDPCPLPCARRASFVHALGCHGRHERRSSAGFRPQGPRGSLPSSVCGSRNAYLQCKRPRTYCGDRRINIVMCRLRSVSRGSGSSR